MKRSVLSVRRRSSFGAIPSAGRSGSHCGSRRHVEPSPAVVVVGDRIPQSTHRPAMPCQPRAAGSSTQRFIHARSCAASDWVQLARSHGCKPQRALGVTCGRSARNGTPIAGTPDRPTRRREPSDNPGRNEVRAARIAGEVGRLGAPSGRAIMTGVNADNGGPRRMTSLRQSGNVWVFEVGVRADGTTPPVKRRPPRESALRCVRYPRVIASVMAAGMVVRASSSTWA